MNIILEMYLNHESISKNNEISLIFILQSEMQSSVTAHSCIMGHNVLRQRKHTTCICQDVDSLIIFPLPWKFAKSKGGVNVRVYASHTLLYQRSAFEQIWYWTKTQNIYDFPIEQISIDIWLMCAYCKNPQYYVTDNKNISR